MTKTVEEFNIETVKRHIKNLIAGNRMSNETFKEFYKSKKSYQEIH